MNKNNNRDNRYQVGDFIVDINAALVETSNGEKRTLQEKALNTLQVFIEEPGKYFTNDELIDIVYNGVSVSTSTIAQNIKQLRIVFDDTNKELFENRPKVGYRLTQSVSKLQNSKSNRLKLDSANKHPRTKTFKTSKKLGSLLIFGVLTTLLVFSVSWFYPNNKSIFIDDYSQRPLSHSKGQEYFPSLSDDGTWLAYSHRHDSDKWSLRVRNMNTDQVSTLLSDSKYSYKHGQITRDGQRVLLTRLSEGNCELVEGQFDQVTVKVTNLRRLHSCDVSAEGARIIEASHADQYIYSNGSAIDAPFSLYTYSTVTGRTEQLTAPPATGRGDYFMRLSPDRSQIVLLRNIERYVTEIRLLDLDKRDNVLLERVNTTLFSVNWSFAGDALIYKNASNQVIAQNLSTREKEIVKQARFPIYAPFPTNASNSRIGVISGSLVDRDIVSLELDSLTNTSMLDSSFSDTLPIYAPRTNRLAWISNRSGLFQLWLKDGNQTERVLTNIERVGRFTSLDFSVDGQKIGGTFEGRWFIYNLADESLKWGKSSEHRYSNFSWQHNNQSAYILETYRHESIMKTLDIAEGSTSRHSLFPDANLVKSSPDGKWLYVWFKESHRFIRINQYNDELIEISRSNQAARTNQWTISNQAIIWVEQPADGPAYLLQLGTNESMPSNVRKESYYGSVSQSPQNNSVILTKQTRGAIELIEI